MKGYLALDIDGTITDENEEEIRNIILSLKEYSNNISAAAENIHLNGLYRTGGILKIRVDTEGPVISLNGSNNYDTYINKIFIDPLVTIIDNIDIDIIPIVIGTIDTDVIGN